MVEQLKKQYLNNKIQFIEIAKDGTILQSDNNIFNFKKEKSIYNIHPFFESIQYYFNENKGSEFNISCINLNIGTTEGIFDLIIHVLTDTVILSILDFTAHYKISNTLSQEKNESVIQSQILKEREEFKNRFLANTSHELRTPLNSIMGFTTILQRSNLNQNQLHYLNIIKQSSENLRNIIDDILDISKIEMGRLKIRRNRFDFYNAFQLLKDSYFIKTKAKKLEFKYQIDSKIPQFLVGDKYRLNQILTNLLNNAVKFTNEGSINVNVKLLERKSNHLKLEIKVSDTGIGIDPDKLDSVFESFTQLHDVNLYGGTGLGLSIVKSLVGLMRGQISVESQINQGTTFTLHLAFDVSANQEQDDDLVASIEISNKTKKYNILVADDVELNQLLLMKILADYGKYYVDIVSNGDQVIERLHQSDYDLVLMDLKMPKMDGYDTTRFIRQSTVNEFKNIPIIALTAEVSPLEREVCIGIGMNDYIGKPFNEKELIQKIDNQLKKQI